MSVPWSTCAVTLPNHDHWLPIDFEAEPPQEWAAGLAREALGDEAPGELVEGLTQDLAWYRARAETAQAFLAAAYRPGPEEPITLFLHVSAIEAPPSADVLGELERTFRSRRSYVLGDAEVEVVRRPAGPAVRVRELAGGPVDDSSAEVMEYVSHYLVPDGFPESVIEITLTWGSLPLGEVYAQMADAVAESLAVQA